MERRSPAAGELSALAGSELSAVCADEAGEYGYLSTAVILAGGESRRMGRDKLLLGFDGRTLLESAAERFSARFDVVLVSAARRDAYADMRFDVVPDIYPGCGPLSGLHAALTAADGRGVFLVAGDLPFADPLAALRLIELCGEHEISVIGTAAGKPEPLFGFYKKKLLPRVESALREGRYRMTELLASSDTLYVPASRLGALWNKRLLFNINSPDDYAAAHRAASRY
ncbi:MAG: molybdenum cofactor guanylyltransferase [Oscillospiraceae bacterium]|nr:molybdenum cofactor guanylyltransferase [Oscillospiraceae bacterium]